MTPVIGGPMLIGAGRAALLTPDSPPTPVTLTRSEPETATLRRRAYRPAQVNTPCRLHRL